MTTSFQRSRSPTGQESTELGSVPIALASFALAVLGSLGVEFRGSGTLLGFYSPFTRAWEFAVGALLALTVARIRRSPAVSIATGIGALGLALLGLSLFLISDLTPFPGIWTLLPVSATLLLLFSGLQPRNPISRLLSSRPATRVGDWSYSIYLWHWPFIVFAALIFPGSPRALILGAAASLVPSLLSYRWVETPLRNPRDGGLFRLATLATIVIAVPLALALALGTAAVSGWWSHRVQVMQASVLEMHAGVTHGCNIPRPLDPQRSGPCVWNADSSGAPIYLLGDSHADHFSEAFIAASRTLARPLFVASPNGCPFISGEFPDRARHTNWDTAQCREAVEGTLTALENAQRGTVVISNSSAYWQPERLSNAPFGALPSALTLEKRQAYEAGLRETVRAITHAGHEVIVVQDVPDWADSPESVWDPSTCSLLEILANSCRETRSMPQAVLANEWIRNVNSRVAKQAGESVWDPTPSLCPSGLCSTQSAEYSRYRDSGHLSVPQAWALGGAVTQLLRDP